MPMATASPCLSAWLVRRSSLCADQWPKSSGREEPISNGSPAVAIGLALDTTYSHLSGFLAEDDWRRVIALLRALGLAVYAPELNHRIGDHPAILRGLDEFREHLGGRLTIMLLRAIGVPFDAHEIDKGVMLGSVEILRTIEAERRAEDAHGQPLPFDAHRHRR